MFKIKLKRGNSLAVGGYVGSPGELTLDLERKVIQVHDGISAGGHDIGVPSPELIGLGNVENYRMATLQESVEATRDDLYISPLKVKELIENGDFVARVNTGEINPQDVLLKINGNYGWRSMAFNLTDQASNSNRPTFATYREGVQALSFQDRKNKQINLSFQMGHDYALGTVAFPYLQWSVNSSRSGTVRWGVEYTVSKAHGQSSFGPTSVVYITENVAANSQYALKTSELLLSQAIGAGELEPDSVVILRIFRDTENDSFPDNVFLHAAAMHYQIARLATTNRSPNFYG